MKTEENKSNEQERVGYKQQYCGLTNLEILGDVE